MAFARLDQVVFGSNNIAIASGLSGVVNSQWGTGSTTYNITVVGGTPTEYTSTAVDATGGLVGIVNRQNSDIASENNGGGN